MLVLLSAGCGGSEPVGAKTGTCEELAARIRSCLPPDGRSREELVLACRKYPIDLAAVTSCGVLESCAAFESCLALAAQVADPARREKRLQGLIEHIEEGLADGRFEDVERACGVAGRDLDPDPMTLHLCKRLPAIAVRDLWREVEEARDGTGPLVHLSRCVELRKLAARVGDADAGAAETLCRELSASLAVARAMSDADVARRAERPRFPESCGHALALLDQLATDWAALARPRVLRECYVTLGAAVLESRRGVCDHQVRKLLAAVTRHGIRDPALEQGARDARGLCGE